MTATLARTRVFGAPMTELPALPVLQDGERIDWERVIMDIQRSTWLCGSSDRYSLRLIARECGRGANWAWNLKNIPNTEPRFHDALMLLGLWSQKAGADGRVVPVHREFERRPR